MGGERVDKRLKGKEEREKRRDGGSPAGMVLEQQLEHLAHKHVA